MKTKEVLLLLTDQWADWEAAYVIPSINGDPQYTLKTIATDTESKRSMGGLRTEIDCSISTWDNFDNLAMLILPGGAGWKNENNEELVTFIKKVIDLKIPVAAICGATIYLGKHGLLDQVNHTGDELELFKKESGYHGDDFYQSTQIIMDKDIITANETAALEFTKAIFKVLHIATDEQIEGWYHYFKLGMVQ